LRGIGQSFQQSYPQFFGTASKDHEKQRLTRDFKNTYEQEMTKYSSDFKLNLQRKGLDAHVA
jgi:hypothetical protein